MSYELPDEGDSEIRKRAAWLLGMLALVAALFVGIMITVVGTGSGGSNKKNADPVVPSSPSATPTSSGSTAPGSSTAPSSRSASTSTSPVSSTSAAPRGSASCPTPAKCALTGDIGNAIAAVNAYRTQHGKAALTGTVAADATKCALTDGSDCPDAFAESQVPGPDGASAVAKIESLAKLLDPAMKSFGVGWAYDPGSKAYYFAVVRNQ